jgi:hypothetical protein
LTFEDIATIMETVAENPDRGVFMTNEIQMDKTGSRYQIIGWLLFVLAFIALLLYVVLPGFDSGGRTFWQ